MGRTRQIAVQVSWAATLGIALASTTLRTSTGASGGASSPDANARATTRPAGAYAEQWLPPTGRADARLERYDELMRQFMSDKHVPGAALTVSYQGRIVYERGFGCADKSTGRRVAPRSLFRVASVSKPLTAVAVLQIVRRAANGDPRITPSFGLDWRPFRYPGGLKRFEPKASDPPRAAEISDITIRQLLHHTAGWDGNMSFEPSDRQAEVAEALGKDPPVEAEDLIAYRLKGRLDFKPGSRYAYSNIGYSVLGRVIAEVSGEPYEKYVSTHVLGPLGLTDMKIGKTLWPDRDEAEVRYYAADGKEVKAVVGKPVGRPVAPAYGGFYLEAMDSEGGWLATATDLVNFANALAGANGMVSRDGRIVLDRESVAGEMFAPRAHDDLSEAKFPDPGSMPDNYYALGWNVSPTADDAAPYDPLSHLSIAHDGLLRGCSSALVVHRPDGLCWAALFNTDVDRCGQSLALDVAPLLAGLPSVPAVWEALTAHSPKSNKAK